MESATTSCYNEISLDFQGWWGVASQGQVRKEDGVLRIHAGRSRERGNNPMNGLQLGLKGAKPVLPCREPQRQSA